MAKCEAIKVEPVYKLTLNEKEANFLLRLVGSINALAAGAEYTKEIEEIYNTLDCVVERKGARLFATITLKPVSE